MLPLCYAVPLEIAHIHVEKISCKGTITCGISLMYNLMFPESCPTFYPNAVPLSILGFFYSDPWYLA